MLLAYAVEFSLKHLLSEHHKYADEIISKIKIKKSRIATKDHDLVEIFDCLEREGILQSEHNITALLQYLNYHSTRYPTKIIGKREQNSKDKRDVSSSMDPLPHIDDLIIELDYMIFSINKDPSVSVYVKAFNFIEDNSGFNFFGGNNHIAKYFEEYKKLTGVQTSIDVAFSLSGDFRNDQLLIDPLDPGSVLRTKAYNFGQSLPDDPELTKRLLESTRRFKYD